MGSSPLTPIPFNCQQSPPINPPHPLPSPDTLLRAPGAAGGSQPCQEPGSAGPTEAGGRSSRQDAPPRVGCRGGSPHHPDPSSPQPGDFTHPVPQERARPRGPVSFQRQRRVEEKKKKKRQTTRAGWGHHAAGTQPRAETSEHLLSSWVKWGVGGKKTKPKTTAFKQLLFTVCTEPSGQSIPVQRPLRAGCDTDTHRQTETDGPPPPPARAPPAGQRGEARRELGAARLLRGRGRASAWGEPLWGWGSRGPESPCPRALGSSWEQGLASSRAWCPEPWHEGGDPAEPQVPLAEPKCACSSAGLCPRPGEAALKAEGGREQDPLPWGLGSTCRRGGGGCKSRGFAESQLRNQLKSHGQEFQAGLAPARHWGGTLAAGWVTGAAPSSAPGCPQPWLPWGGGQRLLRQGQEQPPQLPQPTAPAIGHLPAAPAHTGTDRQAL